MWQKRAHLEEGAKPLPTSRTISNRSGSGLWPTHRHRDLALQFAHHQLAATGGNGEKRVRSLAMTAPDPFDKRRIGCSVLVKENHFPPPEFDTQRFSKRVDCIVPTALSTSHALFFQNHEAQSEMLQEAAQTGCTNRLIILMSLF